MSEALIVTPVNAVIGAVVEGVDLAGLYQMARQLRGQGM